ncbi:uncharacterized protein KQ657_000532 [Scheffersomyces spartinae]|uniref:Uncharacterized protein n=1 Tax=Scheffersomyces spartinae TaxID=45513 RepID=A0A9P7V9R9_9ASCO|nr:uncharacterized protein KQ657_000532 [Scheffersomyces spartinae]KAG7193834.1 hypothetical protein KQ657_000532 [Scheffersomyces spartinae]
MGCSGLQAPGLWKHPDDKSPTFNTVEYWTNLAKLLEKGKFNALFIADVLGPYDVYNGPRNISNAARSGAQWPITEPSAVVSAMAAVTKNLAFGVTFSTISEAPYHIKFIAVLTTVIGKTHEEAERKYKKIQSYGDLEGAKALFSGWGFILEYLVKIKS